VNEPDRSPTLAVFDFDGTITYVDSFLPFLRHASRFHEFAGKFTLSFPTLLRFAFGFLSNEQAKSVLVRRFLASLTPAQLAAHSHNFALEKLKRLVNPKAIERIRWHQQQGHTVVVLSASLENYIQPWAQAEGIQDVLCTRLNEHCDLAGRNCHGEEKVRRLQQAFGELSRYTIYAYGDSPSDRPVLALARHPFYRSFEGASLKETTAKHLLFCRAVLF
jgi:phosphatidylglycerophosphatase C